MVTRRKWLQNIVFTLFLVFFSWRLVEFFFKAVPLFLGWSQLAADPHQITIWQIIQHFGDLGFFVFLLSGRKRQVVFSLALVWMIGTLFLAEGGFCDTYAGLLKAFPYLIGAFLAACSFFLVFPILRIRGKIFLVCIFCAGIPMLFLGLALFQQNDFLLEHALFPFAREMMFAEARRLDLILSKRFEQSLLKFLDLPVGSAPLPIFSDSEYIQRAAEMDLPLIAIKERNLKPLNPGLSSNPIIPGRGERDGVQSKRDLEMGSIFQEESGNLGFFTLFTNHPGRDLIFAVEIPRKLASEVVGIVELDFDFSIWAQKALSGIPILSFNHLSVIFPADPKTMTNVFSEFKRVSEQGILEENPWRNAKIQFNGMTDGHYWGKGLPAFPGSFELLPTSSNQGGPQGLTVRSGDGMDFLVDSWSLAITHANIAFIVPVKNLRQLFLDKQIKSIMSCIVAVLFALLLSLLYSERLSHPINEITEAARAIRDGNLETIIPAESDQVEIRELAETLSLMSEKLKGRIEIANQQLVMEKGKFETLVESTWEGIFLLSSTGEIIYANHPARQLLGIAETPASFFSAMKSAGKDFQPGLPERLSEDIREFKAIFNLPLGQKGSSKIISLYLKSIQKETPRNALPADSPDSGFIAVCRDITAEKEIDRMKNDFVSQVSHELRTPLTSIQAYTEMLLDGEAGDFAHQKDYLKIIYDESERLTRLINDLLDIARIESGRRVIKPVVLDLNTISENIVQVLSGQASRKSISLSLVKHPSPANIHGDEDLIKQAGLNMLSNALKYTKEGGTVKISIEKARESFLAWKFTDTGIGMTPQDRDRLFTKFFRADSDFVRAAGGTGLGLTLVKHIVDLHQGEILVESDYGKGTCFSILLKQTLTSI